MKIGNSFGTIELDKNEYCITTAPAHYTSKSFKVKFPKLMSELSSANKEVFNRNIFLNDKPCKPVSANSVSLLNYITVERSEQCSLIAVADINGIVPAGTTLVCLCMNNNIKDMKIIDHTR